MELFSEMKKKILSVFGDSEEEQKIEVKSVPSLDSSGLDAEEIEKLKEYPSLRNSTPENRDISPY